MKLKDNKGHTPYGSSDAKDLFDNRIAFLLQNYSDLILKKEFAKELNQRIL